MLISEFFDCDDPLQGCLSEEGWCLWLKIITMESHLYQCEQENLALRRIIIPIIQDIR